MAYTKTPLVNTEQTTPIALMHEWNSRQGEINHDVDNLNVLFEPVVNQMTGDQYFEVMKRDGTSVWVTTPGPIQYSFDWNSASQYVVKVSNVLYAYDKNTGAQLWSYSMPSTTATNTTEFAEYQGGTFGLSLIVVTGQFNYVITTAGVATSITLPSGALFLNHPVVLDGYLFLAGTEGTIWNSKLNDPTDFTGFEFISAEDYPDNLQALARMGPYIVAFGGQSIQFFYDNANEVGTPLNKHSTTLKYGFSGGVASYGDSLIFVGYKVGGDVTVFKLEDFKVTDIGSTTFSRWYATKRSNVQGGITYFSRWAGNIVVLNGHSVYIPTLFYEKRPGTSDPDPLPPFDISYGVDLNTNLWSRYSFKALTAFQPTGYGDFLTTLVGDANIYKIIKNSGADDGVIYPVQFVTPIQDFGSHRMKFGGRFIMWADQTSTPTYSMVSWTKDDYQTYTVPRAVDMSHQYQQLYRLGSFRKLAFKVTYDSNTPMRWKLMELDYSIGQA